MAAMKALPDCGGSQVGPAKEQAQYLGVHYCLYRQIDSPPQEFRYDWVGIPIPLNPNT
jgi:hypothetical protein